jgi:hypothetical protein
VDSKVDVVIFSEDGMVESNGDMFDGRDNEVFNGDGIF